MHTTNLGYEHVNQIDFSYKYVATSRLLELNVYNKNYVSLLKYNAIDTTLGGTGYARGVDLIWKDSKSIKGFEYWFTYSYIDTERDYLNYPIEATPSFISKQIGSLTVKTFIPRPSLFVGVLYAIKSGRPYYNPNLPTDEFNTGLTPVLQNLDITIVHIRQLDNIGMQFILSAKNLLGPKQIYGYQYTNYDLSQREELNPINQPFIYLGFVVNWNKSQDTDTDILNQYLN